MQPQGACMHDEARIGMHAAASRSVSLSGAFVSGASSDHAACVSLQVSYKSGGTKQTPLMTDGKSGTAFKVDSVGGPIVTVPLGAEQELFKIQVRRQPGPISAFPAWPWGRTTAQLRHALGLTARTASPSAMLAGVLGHLCVQKACGVGPGAFQ